MSTTGGGKHGLSAEELKKITDAKKAYMEAAANGSTEMADLAREYHDTVIDILISDHTGESIPGPLPGCGPNPDPEDEHIAHGGWGGDTAAPKTWDAVKMKDDPKLWKVVDKEEKNIAHKFESEQEAQKYIDWHVCKQEQGLPTPVPPPGPPPPAPVPPPSPPSSEPGATGDGPYPVKGEKMNHTIRGPTTRHYASGKPDDETIEANVKGIKFPNHQFVVDITINDMEHDDNASMKIGGNHMTNGWFDNGIGVYTGQACLGTEVKHPSTKLCIVKGDKIGDIRGKRIKIGAIYRKDTNHTELWTNLGQGWKKNVEGDNIGGFNSKASTYETQLRIDGFKKGSVPKIHAAWVSEI